jgi:hypothetical protein
MKRSHRLLSFVLFVAASFSTYAAPYGDLEIKVLSNRADLISADDALVEVVLPYDVNPSLVRVSLDGRDVTGAFAVRPDGRFYGLVTGLSLGPNEVLAYVLPDPKSKRPPQRPSARITITNHRSSGPVFSGAQLQPWICAHRVATPVTVTVPGTTLTATATTRASGLDADPLNEQCDAPVQLTFYYQPKSKEGTNCTFTSTGTNACFVPFDPAARPADADIADFTNDRGDTVKSIAVLERGTVDRGMYQLVTFYDPSKPYTPWAPQKGWNGKLLWRFGASSSYSRFQTAPGTGVFDDTALRRGFMVASGSLTDHGTNANDTLGAESMMMVKEHIIETYGEIRYTMGAGCSGGSIYQYFIAGAYPGLLNGIQPNCTFPDTMTTSIEVQDCGLLQANYYSKTPSGSALSLAQRAAINGHNNTGFCATWISSFLPNGNPTRSSNCGSGFPAALTYDPALRPDGVRCDSADHDASLLGTFIDTDGVPKASSPLDNEGVQYGLKALHDGVINAEEFVTLNEGVGSYTADQVWVPPLRKRASTATLHTVYTSGIVSDGRQLAKVAIIDLRGNQTAAGDIHANWRSFQARARLDNANGHHDNQLIWAFTGGGAAQPGAALALRSFLTLDSWLSNIEADTRDLPIADKVRFDKPSGATDICLNSNGATETSIVDVGLGSPACPLTYQGSPRQGAGGPLSEDVFKCQLKALDFGAPEYGGVAFTADQQARLAAVFPTGVCDWTKPGVEQVPADGGTTFAAGPGGAPLGAPPASTNGCPGYSQGNGNATVDGCPGQSAGPAK